MRLCCGPGGLGSPVAGSRRASDKGCAKGPGPLRGVAEGVVQARSIYSVSTSKSNGQLSGFVTTWIGVVVDRIIRDNFREEYYDMSRCDVLSHRISQHQ